MTVLFNTLGIPDFARPLARLINDYDPNLTLERLPDSHPRLIDNPDHRYAVIDRPLGLPEYIVASYPEHLLDHRVFADVIAASAREHQWDINVFDPVTAAHNLLEARRREDENEARADKIKYAMEKRRWS